MDWLIPAPGAPSAAEPTPIFYICPHKPCITILSGEQNINMHAGWMKEWPHEGQMKEQMNETALPRSVYILELENLRQWSHAKQMEMTVQILL